MDTVSAAAGIAGRGHLFDIIEAAVSKQPGNALAVADNLYSMSKDMTKLCSELTDQFRNLMLLKVCPEKTDLIVCMPDELDRLKNISAKLELSEILAKLTVLQECSERMGKALNKRIEFEMCLIKLCSVQIQQKTIDNTEIYDKIKQVDNVSVPEKTERPAETEETASPKPAVNMSQLKASDFKPLAEWSEILAEFTKVSPSVSGTLAGSRAFVYSNIMLIDTKNQFFLKLFKVKENFALLTETIRRVMGKSYVIKARCSAAAESEQKAGKLIEKAVSSGIETVVKNNRLFIKSKENKIMKSRVPKNIGGAQNMNSMIKQAQKMQDEITELQNDIEARDFSATSGGGAVEVVVTGAKNIKALTIKPEVVDKDDVEMLQDLIISAINEAMADVEKTTEEEMNKITGGVALPGLF